MEEPKDGSEEFREFVSENEAIFPRRFLIGLRACLRVGMSVEQIGATLLLAAGLYEMESEFEPDTLSGRALQLLRLMKTKQDLDEIASKSE